MNRPPPYVPAPAVTVPGWVLLAGAALAACLATSVPGLVLLLQSFDRSYADMRALVPELLVGGVACVFGAVTLRAQCLARGRWVGGLLAAANLGLIAVIGLGIDVDLTSGSTVSGPAFLVGLVVLVGVLFANALLAGATWWLLAALARRVTGELSASPPALDGASRARVHVATSLLAAAAAHVVVKGVSGGPVLFGVLAALVAGGLLLGARGAERQAGLLGGVIAVIVLGLGATTASRVRDMRRKGIANIPQCTESTNPSLPGGHVRDHDVLARAARRVPGVADAASDWSALPDGTFRVTVYVLPNKGGPLAPALQSAVEAAIAPAQCGEGNDGARPAISVQGARYVPFAVRARVVVKPGADEAHVRASVNRAVHDAYGLDADVLLSAAPRELVRTRERSRQVGPSPEDPGIVYVQFRVGEGWLETYVQQLPPGSVPVVERVDVDLAAEQDGAAER
jgi:hypothetical protein